MFLLLTVCLGWLRLLVLFVGGLFLVACLVGVGLLLLTLCLWVLIWLCLRYIWRLPASLCWFDCLWVVVFGDVVLVVLLGGVVIVVICGLVSVLVWCCCFL